MKKLSEPEIRAVAKAYKPRGWKVVERKPRHNLDGLTMSTRKTIYCPPLTTTYGLYVFFHEVGHVTAQHLNDNVPDEDLPLWLVEYEAEQFALKAMRECEIPVTRWLRDACRKNVATSFREEPHTIDVADPKCVQALKFAFRQEWKATVDEIT